MNILAISGSVRKDSYNTALLNEISELSPKHIHVNLFDATNQIPIFNPELADEYMPDSVLRLLSMIRESDGIIFSAPEYAHGVSGVLKNLLDWLVASDAPILKPVMVTSVSTSGLGGVRSFSPLITILTAMNTFVVIEASFCVPYAKEKFDASLNLNDEITTKRIEISMQAFERAISTNKQHS